MQERGQVTCGMNDAGNFDAVGCRPVEDQIIARTEGSRTPGQVVSQLAHQRLGRQQSESPNELFNLSTRRRRIAIGNVVCHLIEIALGKVG